jgi:predicted enzyme related to lactoylglutathione lyase
MKNLSKIFLAVLLFCFQFSTLSAQDNECACCKPEFQQFSFWEGDWEVFGYDGTKQGTNKVVFLQDKCVLQENWNGLTANDAGTSYNFYNAEKKQWEQVWISNKGYVLEMKGNFTDSSMVLKSEVVKDFKGNLVINRVTWTKQSNGDVKQVWQVSADNEKTWTYQFYGIYKRKQIINQNDTINNISNMKKVTGIGGVFFKCKDPNAMKDWYKTHLGLDTDQYGTNFEWRQGVDSTKYGFTQWSPFAEKTTYFEPSSKEFMINYRVENLELLVEELKKEGVTILDKIEVFEYGKFVHILDLEGNKIELWEPNDIEYNKIVGGRTK